MSLDVEDENIIQDGLYNGEAEALEREGGVDDKPMQCTAVEVEQVSENHSGSWRDCALQVPPMLKRRWIEGKENADET